MHSFVQRFSKFVFQGLAVGLMAIMISLSCSSVAMAQTLLRVPQSPYLALFSFSGQRPDFIGVHNDQLAPCPQSPNCVSSQAQDSEHQIQPLSYTTSAEQAMVDLVQIIQSQDGAKIITEEPAYLYAEYTSKLMGFVDDVEFYLNPKQGKIEVRSASRLGESDLGVNRKRIESIRAELQVVEGSSASHSG